MNAIKIIDYLRAGYPAIWIKTSEPERIETELAPLIKDFQGLTFNIMNWDLISAPDPMQPIAQLVEAQDNSILFAFNYHWFLTKPQPIQALKNSMASFSASGKCFVIVSHAIAIPAELEKDFIVMELALPGEESINQTIDYILPENIKIGSKDRKKVVESSKGLTKKELENVYSLSLVQHKEINPQVVNDFKAQTIAKSGFLSVLKPSKNFEDIIGYSVVKDFILSTIDNPSAKGVILIGPPGCGKTSLAEAIVAQTGKFGISVDMGKLFSKFVGDTDKNVDYAINVIKSIGNCLVLIDEMEKSFAGAGGSGDGDSGTTRRALAKWLDFLQNRPEGVYVVGTCNSFQGMPPEYLRPGRWDTSPFYIDLPNDQVRSQILSHYAEKMEVKIDKTKLDLNNFSGAELEALVKIAAMRGTSLKQALSFVIPIAKTMPQQINELRQWATKSCIPSDQDQSKTLQRRLSVED